MSDQVAASPAATLILLTGASGYIGGRLLESLERRGYRLRCLALRPGVLQQKVDPSTEVLSGDVLDRPSLDAALGGVDAAYYLVHSMGSTGLFEDADREQTTAGDVYGLDARVLNQFRR